MQQKIRYTFKNCRTTRKVSNLIKQLRTFSNGETPKEYLPGELIKDTVEFVLRRANSKPEFAIANDLIVTIHDILAPILEASERIERRFSAVAGCFFVNDDVLKPLLYFTNNKGTIISAKKGAVIYAQY